MVAGVRERVLEFLANYGERGLAVLRAAVDATVAGRRSPGVRLGDFSYREVVARLNAWGVNYNPSMLLRILEKDYGIIETSYKSGNQHWWKFIDFDAVVEAIEDYMAGVSPDEVDSDSEVDPEVELVRAQLAALEVDEVLAQLRRIAAKQKLTRQDRLVFKRIVFDKLELVVQVLRRAEELGLEEEAEILKKIITYVSKISRKLLREARASIGSMEAEAKLLLSETG